MANYKYLGLRYLWVHPQDRPNCKCASLARAVLALCNQVDVLVLVGPSDHWDRDTLNVRRLEELQLFDNALENVFWNLEVVLVLPRALLVNKGRRALLRLELEQLD